MKKLAPKAVIRIALIDLMLLEVALKNEDPNEELKLRVKIIQEDLENVK